MRVLSRKFQWDQISTNICVQDCCDLISQPFAKVNFPVVDVPPQAPTNALAGHCAIIFAHCKLQGVSFQKLVLPHDNIGKSLYTFLEDG